MRKFHEDEVGRLKSLERLAILDTEPEAPFEQIVSLVKQTLGVPICAVSLVDRDRQWFKACRGLQVSETPRDISFCTHAIKSPEPFVVDDAHKHELFANTPLVVGEPYIRSYAGIPLLMSDGYIVGTLCAIDITPREFNSAEIGILSNFAKLVVDEIELRKIASLDALTGVLGRRAWFEAAQKEFGRTARYDRNLTTVMIDIDNFKVINDRLGHATGDAFLKEFVQVVLAEIRQSDDLGRIGGDEFALILPETSIEEGAQLAKRICDAVRDHVFASLGEIDCTVSIGLTGRTATDAALDAMLGRADAALYKAKGAGRDQAVVAEGSADSRADRRAA